MYFPSATEIFLGTFFEGDGSGTPETPPTKEEKPANPPATGTRTYTEDEYKQAIEAERNRANESARKAIVELETLKKQSGTTEAQKIDLQKKIDELNNQFMSKEQILKQEKEKLVNNYEETVKTLTGDRDTWKKRYIDSKIRREISDAANKHEGYNADMFLALLRDKSEIVEETEEGSGRTNFKVKVKMPVDKDGKKVELDFEPEQAIKLMKDDPDQYGFLFKGTNTTGVGGRSSESLKTADYANMSFDEWQKHRTNVLGKK